MHPSLKVKFNKDFKKVNNSEFVEGTALIAYSGDNRNGSDITEQAFNDAIPSLGLIPLVGHWLPDKQNFGGHDITIEWNGNELVLKDNTVPYGVVKENHNAEWIEIEENGKKHKYIKADIVLWYARYPEPIQKVIDTGINQSMEINCKSYSEKGNGNIQIDSFEYSALCLLGLDIDENGNKGIDNVEPCFESASVMVDKFTVNNNFREQFNQLLFALNKSFKIDSYFIPQDKAEKIVEKANIIFTQLGFECFEYVVDGKEYQITGIINKTLNKELSESWGFSIYDKDTITINSLDFETLNTASISISSVELLMNKNINTNQQHFTLKIKNNFAQGGESKNMNKKEDKNLNKIVFSESDMDSMMDEMMEEMKDTMTEEMKTMMDNMKEKMKKKMKEMKPEKDMMSLNSDDVDLSFSATYRQKREALQNALDPKIEKDSDGNIIYEEYLWVEDFDDKYVFVEKSIWTPDNYERKYGRFTYTFDEKTITATISGEFEEMVLVWLTLEENQKLQEDRANVEKISADFKALETKTIEFEATINSLNTEINTLKIANEDLTTYKNKNEKELHEIAVDEILAEFEVTLKDNEEFESIKSKAKDMEIDVLEEKLYALEGKVKHSFKVNKSTKKNSNFSSKVSVIDDSTATESYYGDAVKYIPKI